jgi:hypothetical protein
MSLESILANYEKNSSNANSSGGAKKVDLKDYFSTYLPKGVKEATRKIRLLPDGIFTKVHVHSKKVDGQYRKLVCPSKEKGEDCPFCEAYSLLMEKNTEDDRKLAYTYKARETYIVKVIDREKEDEGVKFWRFNHSRQKDGIYDQIIEIMREAGADISNPEKGRDLTIKITRNQMGIPVVSSILPSFTETPLSTDPTQADAWLSDTRSWEEVYAVKPYDYLRIIVQGGVPVWDKDSETFMDKDEKEAKDSAPTNDNADLERDLTIGGEAPKQADNLTTNEPAAIPVKEESQEDDASMEEEEEDDLPF